MSGVWNRAVVWHGLDGRRNERDADRGKDVCAAIGLAAAWAAGKNREAAADCGNLYGAAAGARHAFNGIVCGCAPHRDVDRRGGPIQ